MVKNFCSAILVFLLIATLSFGQCINCPTAQKPSHSCCHKSSGKPCPMPMPQNSKVCPAPEGVLSSADAQQAPSLPVLATVTAPLEVAAPQMIERVAFLPVAAPPGPNLYVVNSAFLI